MSYIEINNVCKIYKSGEVEIKALDNANFSIEKGELVVILGPSGAGKTTLMNVITGIDTYEEDDKVYVRVMDYKSGSTSFDLTALYNGLQLQLAVYLNAAVAMEKKDHEGKTIIPAGLFYFPMKDPMSSSESFMSQEEISESLFKELALDGICNADPDVMSPRATSVASLFTITPAF